MSTRRFTHLLFGLLLLVTYLFAKADKVKAEGECAEIQQVCTPCTTPENEPITGCQIQFEASTNDFGEVDVRVWGTAPYGSEVIVGREAIFSLNHREDFWLGSSLIGSSGMFVVHDWNPPTEDAIVNYYLIVLVDGEIVCEAHVVMNPPVALIDVSQTPESTSLKAGDIISDSVLINNSGITNTVIVNDSNNVQVSTGDTYSYTYVTETTFISITYNVIVEQSVPERMKMKKQEPRVPVSPPAPKPSTPRDDSDQHSRHTPVLETHPILDQVQWITWVASYRIELLGEQIFEALVELFQTVGVVVLLAIVLVAFAIWWLVHRRYISIYIG